MEIATGAAKKWIKVGVCDFIKSMLNLKFCDSNAIQTIVRRVKEVISSTLTDSTCLQVAISCAMRDPEHVVGFILSHTLAKKVLELRESIKLTQKEWHQLFYSTICPVADSGTLDLAASDIFVVHTREMEAAFNLTLKESDQSEMWKRPWHRIVVYVALHLEYSDEAVLSSIGTIIKADQRRIEDFVNKIDDMGVETLAFSKSIEALSTTIIRC